MTLLQTYRNKRWLAKIHRDLNKQPLSPFAFWPFFLTGVSAFFLMALIGGIIYILLGWGIK